MTQAAQTIIEVATAFAKWIQTHVVAGGEVVRQFVPVLIVFGWVHLTPEQQAVLFSSISGIVAAVVGTNTVSKVRVGERITEGVDKELIARTGTGLTGIINTGGVQS